MSKNTTDKELENLYEYQINKFLHFLKEMARGETNLTAHKRLEKLVDEAENYFTHDLREYCDPNVKTY
jgi:hypothetical protein